MLLIFRVIIADKITPINLPILALQNFKENCKANNTLGKEFKILKRNYIMLSQRKTDLSSLDKLFKGLFDCLRLRGSKDASLFINVVRPP